MSPTPKNLETAGWLSQETGSSTWSGKQPSQPSSCARHAVSIPRTAEAKIATNIFGGARPLNMDRAAIVGLRKQFDGTGIRSISL